MRPGRIALRSSVLLLALAVADRLLERAFLDDDWFLGRAVAPFDPPLFSPSQHQALARIEADLARGGGAAGKFDPELGWCNKPESGFGEFRYDWAGARIGSSPLARERVSGVRRIVAVGCSMTHGEEVGATESWCARLDALEDGLEIANLGVAAYGIDQAFLRLRRDGWRLAPDEVWLGVLPQAALRVTTHFRPILDHWSLDVAFKPRFSLEQEGLVLWPCPASSLAGVVGLLRDQRALLAAMGDRDPWIERARLAYAPRGSSWVHHSFCGRLALTLWERSGRDLEGCFGEEQELGRLYTGIVRAMASECEQRGVSFRVLVLPGESDLEKRSEFGAGYWEAWCDSLRADGVSTIDLAPALEASGLEPGRMFAAGGHYTAEASALVARALSEALLP